MTFQLLEKVCPFETEADDPHPKAVSCLTTVPQVPCLLHHHSPNCIAG